MTFKIFKYIFDLFYFLKFHKLFELYKYLYKQKKLEELKSNLKKVGPDFYLESPFIILNPQFITIGNGFYGLYNNRIEAISEYMSDSFMPTIIFGDNISINTDCHIGCINKIVIEDNVLIASRVFITDHFHGDNSLRYIHLIPRQRPLISKGEVHIKKNVWIGEGVTILPGVTIGENSIIGANSVVTRSIPADVIAGGIPCRVIKKII